MNKRNIFCLITIIVIILLIDIVFNFSKPLFRVSEGFATSLKNNNQSMIITTIMGNIVRIAIEKEKEGSNRYYIPIFDGDDNVLGLDDISNTDGARHRADLVIRPKVPDNLWTLRRFGPNDGKLDNVLKPIVNALRKNDNGAKSEEGAEIADKLNNRQGYILTKQKDGKEYALFYNNNTLTRMFLEDAVPLNELINIGKVSTESIPTKALVLRDFKKSYLGQLNYPSGSGDPDKINIKLNLEDERLKQLLNLNNDVGGTTTGTESEKCDTYLSRDAVKSLCPGCV
jgi:hypothetical protein